MSARSLLEKYEKQINTHDFNEVIDLISADAIFWFSSGSHEGVAAIKAAFEKTWALIQEETYWLSDIRWVSESSESASCVYTFHWKGKISGTAREGSGRGTTLLQKQDGVWKIVHEHLSNFPS